jgi:N-methylhydantoinase A/oxoprolinase/acetone carboxylase beta subunit
MSGYRIGVDVGGTFTDVVLATDEGTVRGKADTTAYDLRDGFFNAVRGPPATSSRRAPIPTSFVRRRRSSTRPRSGPTPWSRGGGHCSA